MWREALWTSEPSEAVLFNSFPFLFCFLPVAFAGFHAAASIGKTPARLWLVLVSLAFYVWWHPAFALLLLASIAFNFSCGTLLRRGTDSPLQPWLLAFAVAVNLAALFYYKYAFVLTAWLAAHGVGHRAWAEGVLLPLGISFFTFTQIGFLIDARDDGVQDGSLLNYVLFVTFFPHLIAGPILHHDEIMPQFQRDETYRFDSDNVSRGYSLFVIGLCKKVLFADSFSSFAGDGFAHPASMSLFAAWGAVMCFALQLYFDFSGYSDMAIGIARMFNIQFPLNFNSPYRATSIVDYWARWHMTLTRYITLYVYNPLAMRATRRLAARRPSSSHRSLSSPEPFLKIVVGPVVFTMMLVGLWHGAGLQFVIFGALHAFYICCNHAWRTFGPKRRGGGASALRVVAVTVGCVALTHVAVLIGQVFFRAVSTGTAIDLLAAMTGLHGAGQPFPVPHALPPLLGHAGDWLVAHHVIVPIFPPQDGTIAARTILALLVGYLIVWFMPNSQTIVGIAPPGAALAHAPPAHIAGRVIAFERSTRWGVGLGAMTAAAVLAIGAQSEFLYFQF
jgi:D-alanyl-lipoteichoic acid acyltransferase DltB (MBOAT superfamily)